MVICGAGAAAISCVKIYKALGVKSDNIIMFDSKGPINEKRNNLTFEKKEFISSRNDIESLGDAVVDSDIFIGLSKANMLNAEMLKTMSSNPIVFAMANPDPEISYQLAISVRDEKYGDRKEDHPNQVNNVLGFPFIFRYIGC